MRVPVVFYLYNSIMFGRFHCCIVLVALCRRLQKEQHQATPTPVFWRCSRSVRSQPPDNRGMVQYVLMVLLRTLVILNRGEMDGEIAQYTTTDRALQQYSTGV